MPRRRRAVRAHPDEPLEARPPPAGDPSERRAYVPVADARAGDRPLPERLVEVAGRAGPVRRAADSERVVLADLGRCGLGAGPADRPLAQDRATRENRTACIPLFPLLRPHLEAAFDHAEEGGDFVFPEDTAGGHSGPGGWVERQPPDDVREGSSAGRGWSRGRGCGTRCGRVARSDLAQSFPLATVTKWLGNTPSVALRHYVDPTETAFDRAASWVPRGRAKRGAPGARNRRSRRRQGIARKRKRGRKVLETVGFPRSLATPCEILHIRRRWRRRESNPGPVALPCRHLRV